MDRLKNLKVTEEHFSVPYRNKFEEGEYRKRIQFMRGGKLRKVKLEYSGFAVEAVLDRLPTARIISEDEGKYVIENVSGDVTADDIVLPDTSYDNFANVGLGIEKIWGYTVLNLKANKTFGGRDGFIINAGIEFKF